MEENGESSKTLWIEETKLERREKKGEIRWPGARRINMATEVKSGVKSGGFWQPLSQDVALLCRNCLHNKLFLRVNLLC
jgi:hypothetical protein